MPLFMAQPEYQRLRQRYAEARGEFAFWIGAGLSQPAGMPGWANLIEGLRDDALNSISTLSEKEARIAEAKLDELNYISDPWEKMTRLNNIMGPASFEASLDARLGPPSVSPPPAAYEKLWQLDRINQVVTLNLDNFVQRSFTSNRPGRPITVFDGKNAGDYAHLVKRRQPFIAQMHGSLENPSSWVITKNQIEMLHRDPKYRNFVELLLQSYSCIFIGVSADDIAVGGFLERLKSIGVPLGDHYWITSRNDGSTHRWGQQAGLQVIRYDPTAGGVSISHENQISLFFDDLINFVPTTAAAPVVTSNIVGSDDIPDPEALIVMNPNEIRAQLGRKASSILEMTGLNTTSDIYKSFLNEYRRPLRLAFFVTDEPPDNEFFGYTLSERVAVGAFSQVWRGYDKEGCAVAIKILNIDNLSSGAQLDSFRRGIQSLQFLTDADVSNVAKMIDAHEIPPSLVMEFIDGPTFRELINSPQYKFWSDGVSILINVADSLIRSHSIGEQVLHRDVRPSNVIVPYFFSYQTMDIDPTRRYDIVLLNYDMSWHKFAKGTTITAQVEDLGFYPPEQIENINGVSSQSTLVDSYMFGMLAYFAATGSIPPRGGSASEDWYDLVAHRIAHSHQSSWRSVRGKFKRLILAATKDSQRERITLTTILVRLCEIENVLREKLEDVGVDFWAEELLNRIVDRDDYFWNDDVLSGEVELRQGRKIILETEPRNQMIRMSFENAAVESTNRSNSRMWSEKLAKARIAMTSGGWRVHDDSTSRGRQIIIRASIQFEFLRKNFDSVVRTTKVALDEVRLD